MIEKIPVWAEFALLALFRVGMKIARENFHGLETLGFAVVVGWGERFMIS